MDIRSHISKRWWDARRFGFSPDKWIPRLTNRTEPKIFCVTVPKSGTHLLERALCLSDRLYRRLLPTINPDNVHSYGGLHTLLSKLRAGEIIISHLPFSENRLQAIHSHRAKSIFMIRDLRDVAVSRTFFIISGKKGYPEQKAIFDAQSDLKSRIMLSIKGHSPTNLLSIGELATRFRGWLEKAPLLVRFEDLIGIRGGGGREKQSETLRNIYDFLGVEVKREELRGIQDQIFSNKSPTFRKGSTGGWKKHFDPEVKKCFKEIAGDELIRYGYENDNSW